MVCEYISQMSEYQNAIWSLLSLPFKSPYDLWALTPCSPESLLQPESVGWRRRPGASWEGLWRSSQLLWRKAVHCLWALWAAKSPWRSCMERAWSWAWGCWLPGMTRKEKYKTAFYIFGRPKVGHKPQQHRIKYTHSKIDFPSGFISENADFSAMFMGNHVSNWLFTSTHAWQKTAEQRSDRWKQR